MEAILSRRSIRKYTDQSVSDEVLKELLNAAMSAPSAGNAQPWHFIVINEHKILNEIPKFHPYSRMLKEAPVAVCVCGDLQREKFEGFWIQDCAAASQNILIAAQAKGLGAVWLGVYPRENIVNAVRKLLSIPEYVTPLCLIAIGHPAEQKPPANRYDPSKIHYNQW